MVVKLYILFQGKNFDQHLKKHFYHEFGS